MLLYAWMLHVGITPNVWIIAPNEGATEADRGRSPAGDTDPTDPHWAVTSGLSKRAAPNPIRPLWKPSLKN